MREIFTGLLMATVLGCSSGSGGTPSHVSDASTGDAEPATFGASACGTCVAKSCSTEIRACDSTPDCQSYLACLDDCPLAADGNVDEKCLSACDEPSSTLGSDAVSQLTLCREEGAGASCKACRESAKSADGGGTDAAAHRDGGRTDAAREDDGGSEDGNSGDESSDEDGGLLHETCADDPDASNGCSRCIHEKCCDVDRDCTNDPSCLALNECEANCRSGLPDDAGATAEPPDGGGDYSCDLWCGATTSPGFDKWVRLLTCSDILCQAASQCGGADACTKCVDTQCANEDVALSATPDGYLFDDCIGQCATTDVACESQCETDYASIAPAFNAFTACTEQNCPSCD